MKEPHPSIVAEGGSHFARWTADDARMRTRNRSVLEQPDRIGTADDAFIAALRSDSGKIEWSAKKDLRDLAKRLEAWYPDRGVDGDAAHGVSFRLVPPSGKSGGNGTWRLEAHIDKTACDSLRALGRACRHCTMLSGMTGLSMEMDRADAERFMVSGAPALKAAGYGVSVRSVKKGSVDAEAILSSAEGNGKGKDTVKRVKAKITVLVDGEKVSREEIAFLLDQGASMVYFRGRWIEIDRGTLRSALKAVDAAEKDMSEREALAFAFGFGRPERPDSVRVKGSGDFGKLLKGLQSGEFPLLGEPEGFAGALRKYQLAGYSWIFHLTRRGFGALLADDMGLGKTVQTIAWLLRRRAEGGGKALVVAPVSVLMNWMRELQRFAPDLPVYMHHGKDRLSSATFSSAVSECAVVVAGYPVFAKDFGILSGAGFDALVLDEAQTVKNPDTLAARAARSFPCREKVALTGTPFENRPADIWSIEEILNPGMLGSRREFIEDFEKPIREGRSKKHIEKLKNAISPFLLRRLKSAPEISAEIGGKSEVREYCVLSPRQRTAYETALARYAASAHDGSGNAGRALALLTELKLACDGLGADGSFGGGKAERLAELLESIFNAGESALVFTQYVKVGEKLKEFIGKRFHADVPFLHGAQSGRERDECIRRFNESQAPCAFVLSIRAGGFGLNLVKATHVIHFDRWWNPAVENQATDRAHRIGQKRQVFVHLFISHGTVEDRIDSMLREKGATADEIVESGEKFLLGLDRNEFRRTVELSEDAK